MQKKKKKKCLYKKPLGSICGLFETSVISQINSLSSVAPPLLYFETLQDGLEWKVGGYPLR